jgi:hypothetical protein
MSFYKTIITKQKACHWNNPFSPIMTNCESLLPSKPNTRTASSPQQQQLQESKSCTSCLVTGIATCTGLSLYFFKMALLDLPEQGSAAFTRTPKMQTNQRFLLACGTFWAVAGIYRWNMG